MLTPLEPQVRFWDKRLEIRGFCPRNGTALLKGFKLGRRTLDTWHLGTDAKGFMSGLDTYYFIQYCQLTARIRPELRWG